MVVTRGFRRDPSLGLLEEAHWRLQIELNEEQWLEDTYLIARLLAWVTVFYPPWFDSTERRSRWEVRQWREDVEGNEVDQAKRVISIPDVLDAVPMRFHSWVIETSREALSALEEVGQDLGSREGADLDAGAAVLTDISLLRSELDAARERQKVFARRAERFYGDVYLYEFAPETDLYWRLGISSEGTECLVVRDVEDTDDQDARALLPPDEITDWRWTALRYPEEGGEYLSPPEAVAKAPAEFRGWVASKTFAALQQTRHAMHELAAQTLLEAQDFAQMARLGKHAQQLAGLSQASAPTYPGAPEIDEEEIVAGTSSPEGRTVLLLTHSWNHILLGHPEMADHLDALMEAVGDPEQREPDVRVGRERFYRRGGPEAWVRVVVEVAGPFDKVITAFPQANRPDRWRPK